VGFGAGPHVPGDLEFVASLHDFDPDYDGIELPQDLQGEADAILSTIEIVTPPAAAVEATPTAVASPPATELTRYISEEFGFAFEYPADWALEVVPRRALEGLTPLSRNRWPTPSCSKRGG
jgi:hypothetical protein